MEINGNGKRIDASVVSRTRRLYEKAGLSYNEILKTLHDAPA